MARFCNSTPRARIIHHKIDVITENCSSKTIQTDLDLVSRKWLDFKVAVTVCASSQVRPYLQAHFTAGLPAVQA